MIAKLNFCLFASEMLHIIWSNKVLLETGGCVKFSVYSSLSNGVVQGLMIRNQI